MSDEIRYSPNGSMAVGEGVGDWDSIPDVSPGGILIFDGFMVGESATVYGPKFDGTPQQLDDNGNVV